MCKFDESKCEKVREKISECCRRGELDGLYLAIREYPQVLQDIQDIHFVSTPLHEAAACGQTVMAIEFMNLMPCFGKKLNPDGLTPLHVAIETGNIDTALALVKIDKQLVLEKGRGCQTPLHLAATASLSYSDDHDKIDRLLVDLLLECPQSIYVLNNKLQTVIHVAADNRRFRAVYILVKWLVARRTESLLTSRDFEGNTALHIAARHGFPMHVLKPMVNPRVINKLNNRMETPMDVATTDEGKRLLLYRGGRNGKDLVTKSSRFDYLRHIRSSNWPEYLIGSYYLFGKELTMEMRNTILVIAVLIATTTYQGVLQPPGGVFSAEGNPKARLVKNETQTSGQMVMNWSGYNDFMPTNTLAFILSSVIIMFVVPTRLFNTLVHATLLCMCSSYLYALRFITEPERVSNIIFIISWCAIVIPFIIKVTYNVVKALYVWGVRTLVDGLLTELFAWDMRACVRIFFPGCVGACGIWNVLARRMRNTRITSVCR